MRPRICNPRERWLALTDLLGDGMDTTMIDRLYLELSQVTKARTREEVRLAADVERLRGLIQGVIQRCEPSGYVGQDGQFLKELAAVFE